MVGMYGIDGVSELVNTKRAQPREKPAVPPKAAKEDQISLSHEAEETLAAARLGASGRAETDARAERIQCAKKNIEDGAYRVQEVVRLVAARISRYISA